MKIIDLLNKIANGEMEESLFYVNGDFFYDLIVIDKNLYVINTTAKKLELLESKYISRFVRDNVELLRLDNFEKKLEEKKIPEKLNKQHFHKKQRQLANKINEIIDYLESKGE